MRIFALSAASIIANCRISYFTRKNVDIPVTNNINEIKIITRLILKVLVAGVIGNPRYFLISVLGNSVGKDISAVFFTFKGFCQAFRILSFPIGLNN